MAHKPKKRFKDCLKQTFKKCSINSVSWEIQAQNRLIWRKVIFAATGRFEESRREHARYKRDLRKKNITEHVSSIVWSGRCPKVSQPRLGHDPASARRKNMLIGCWNVRTLSDMLASSKRPERRTALISRELQRLETRLTGEGNRSDGGYTFFGKVSRMEIKKNLVWFLQLKPFFFLI